MSLLYGQDARVAAWVAARIFGAGASFDPCAAIGVERDGDLAAGVVYHDWQPDFLTIQMSIAAATPRWASPAAVAALLRYPFVQLGANRAWVAVPARNTRSMRLAAGLGFIEEARLAEHFGDDDAVILRMFKREWRERYC